MASSVGSPYSKFMAAVHRMFDLKVRNNSLWWGPMPHIPPTHACQVRIKQPDERRGPTHHVVLCAIFHFYKDTPTEVSIKHRRELLSGTHYPAGWRAYVSLLADRRRHLSTSPRVHTRRVADSSTIVRRAPWLRRWFAKKSARVLHSPVADWHLHHGTGAPERSPARVGTRVARHAVTRLS